MEFDSVVSKQQAKNMNPIVLAFVGDAVYSLFVRKKLALSLDSKSGVLHEKSAKIVSAKAQADFANKIMQVLNEEELDIFRRARNSKKPSHAKNATSSSYNKSTGFEAVIGYLYLIGEKERLEFLLNFENNGENV